MEREGATFEAALKEAQAHGFAEADPTLDVDGWDTAHKAVILASLAYGFPVPMSAVHVEGIRGLAKVDTEYAHGLGYRLKLLAVLKADGTAIEVRVHPTLIPAGHMLASVSGSFNAVMVDGDIAGATAYFGRGAGRLPTASAVLSDLAWVAGALATGAPFPPLFPTDASATFRPWPRSRPATTCASRCSTSPASSARSRPCWGATASASPPCSRRRRTPASMCPCCSSPTVRARPTSMPPCTRSSRRPTWPDARCA